MAQPSCLIVCSGFPLPVISGGGRRTLGLIEAMDAAGIRPHLVSSHVPDPAGVADAEARGWRVDVVPRPEATRSARLEQHARLLPRLHSSALRRRIGELASESVAFVEYEEMGMAQYVGAAPEGVPEVLSLHNVDSQVLSGLARDRSRGSIPWLRGWYHWSRVWRMQRRAARRATAVLCCSVSDGRYFSRLNQRAVVAPNGVDDGLFQVPQGRDACEDVLFFGQWGYRPNVVGATRFIREAWPAVARARPQARLRLAGGGPAGEVAAAAASAERVELLGFVEDLTPELASARVVVVPLWQGSGTRLKALEAMAAARPLVGTSLGLEGIGFQHGRHGLVADTPAKLAAATVRLLEAPAAAMGMGAEARRHVEQYRWAHAMAPARELYAELAESHGPRAGHGSSGAARLQSAAA